VHKYSFKKYIYFLLNIFLFFLTVSAGEIKTKKERFFKQNRSQIIWEKVNQDNQKPLRWEIDKNQTPVNLKKNYKENINNTAYKNNPNKIFFKSSSFLLNRGEKIFNYGYSNNKSDFYILRLGLSKDFNIDFSSELINTKNKHNNPNKFISKFLENGSRNFRSGGTLQIFSQYHGDLITSIVRLSYGEIVSGSRKGYIYSEIINKYSKSDRLSFNLNPEFSFTSSGNIFSVNSGFNWRLNPKYEIIPQANISLHNGSNNFSLTGRTYLNKNLSIDTFVTNSFGVIDMAKQFKSESNNYGIKLKFKF